MAVTEVNETMGRSAGRTVEAEDLKRIFIVQVDDKDDGARVAQTAAGIPKIGDAHPDNAAATARNVDADETESRLVFMVVVKYSTTVSAISPTDNPLDEEPIIRWGSIDREVILDKDIFDAPITNSAGDVYAPPLTKERAMQTCTIERNEATFDPLKARRFLDSINLVAINVAGFPLASRQGLLKKFGGRTAQRNNIFYFAVTYEIHVANDDRLVEGSPGPPDEDPLFWRIDIVDQGFNKFVGGVKKQIRNADGSKPSEPKNLDLLGDVLDDGETGKFQTIEAWETLDWTDLALPPNV